MIGKQVRVSLGTKKVASLTVGEMIRNMMSAADGDREILNQHIMKCIDDHCALLIYAPSESKKDISMDLKLNENAHFKLGAKDNTISHFMSATFFDNMNEFITTELIDPQWLKTIFPAEFQSKWESLSVTKDNVEIIFTEWLKRELIDEMDRIFRVEFPNSPRYLQFVQRYNKEPFKSFEMRGFEVTYKQWAEDRWNIRVQKQL